MPKISIIMPSLNVAAYIRQCMDSVIGQTLEDIEILAIDAGSQDGTLEILQEYAKKDSRVKVIYSNRKSYGYQINLGLEMAQGDFIGIVETDDRIPMNAYETMYEVAIAQKADYVKGRADKTWEMSQEVDWHGAIGSPLEDACLHGKVIVPCEMPQLLLRDIYLWNGIYKKEFVKGIRLNESPGAAFQDQGFLLQTLSQAKRAIYVEDTVYWYRQDNSNSSIYNVNGFRYILEEYAANYFLLDSLSREWTWYYYGRMLQQSIGRFETMAMSGSYWESAREDIAKLQLELKKALETGALNKEILPFSRQELLDLWLEDEQLLWQRCCQEVQKDKTCVRKLYEQICVRAKEENRPVVMFGAGRVATFVHVLLHTMCEGVVSAYMDHKESIQGTRVQGVEILSPQIATERYPEAIYLVASARYSHEMKAELETMGIGLSQIIVYSGEIHQKFCMYARCIDDIL